MSTEPKTVWGIADSRETERWSGAETSREAAIAEGRATYPGKGFWICSGTVCTPGQFMPDADWVIEDASQRAGDEVGEAAEDWPPEPSKEAREELNAFLEGWADKHLPCAFWSTDADPEFIEPAPATSPACRPGAWGGPGCLAHEGYELDEQGLCIEGRSEAKRFARATPPIGTDDEAGHG